MSELGLKTDAIDASYDAEDKLLIVAYTGVLSSDVTSQFYTWLGGVMANNPELVASARGSIYDFRKVTEFQANNIVAARKESSSLSKSADVREHPVALIVETMLQERMVQSTMRLTQQLERKSIVHSMEEAKAFINEWYDEED